MIFLLFLSLTLHATFVFFPYFGRHVEKTSAPHSGVKPSATLTVRLATEKNTARINEGRQISAHADEKAPPTTHRDETVEPTRTIGADLLPMHGQTYYPTDQLSKRPQPVDAMDMDSPELRGLTQSGKIAMRLWIDESGGVSDVEVEKTDLPDAYVTPVVKIFLRSRFLPGERGGRKVGSLMRIEVDIDAPSPNGLKPGSPGTGPGGLAPGNR